MFGKTKDSINGVLRARKDSGTQFLTKEGKEKLIETKLLFRQYLRLFVGLFLALVVVALAFVRLLERLLTGVILPLIAHAVSAENLNITLEGTESPVRLGAFIGYVLIFAATCLLSWMLVGRIAGRVEVPAEEKSRRCPMCGERILEIAMKCKHCGSTVGRERTFSHRPVSRTSADSPAPSRRRPDSREGYSSGRRPERAPEQRTSERRPETRTERRPEPAPPPQSTGDDSRGASSRRRSSYSSRRKPGRYHSGRDQPRSGGDQR